MGDVVSANLLDDIAYCPNIVASRSDPTHLCHRIVSSQDKPGQPSQLPEPWSGFLHTAPILFVSSNPSISYSEDYPLDSPDWPKDEVARFFTHKFHDGWVQDGRYTRVRNPDRVEYSKYPTKYWSTVRKRAMELLERDVVPGEDYCLTEVVHCKSKHEIGVKEAAAECTKRYLRRVLNASGAKVIVVYGAFAEKAVKAQVQLCGGGHVQTAAPNEHFSVLCVFVPHPAGFGPKEFQSMLAPDELELLRDNPRG